MAESNLERLYRQRLKEKSSDELFIELAEARRAEVGSASAMLVEELESRGLRTDQPEGM